MLRIGQNLSLGTNYQLNQKAKNNKANSNSASSVNFKGNPLDFFNEEDNKNAKTIAEFLDNKVDSSAPYWRVGCHNSKNTMVYIYKDDSDNQYVMKMFLYPPASQSGVPVVAHIKFSNETGVKGIEYSYDYDNKMPVEDWREESTIDFTKLEIQLTLKELASEPERLISGQW